MNCVLYYKTKGEVFIESIQDKQSLEYSIFQIIKIEIAVGKHDSNCYKYRSI